MDEAYDKAEELLDAALREEQAQWERLTGGPPIVERTPELEEFLLAMDAHLTDPDDPAKDDAAWAAYRTLKEAGGAYSP